MFTFDKIKNASANIVKNLKSNIQPCDGPSYEYSSNDEDYNEFLRNIGADKPDYAKTTEYECNEEGPKAEEAENTATQSEKKSEDTSKKTFDNISDIIFDKFNQIKSSIETNKNVGNSESFEKIHTMIDELSEIVKDINTSQTNVYAHITQIKADIENIVTSSKSNSAETAFALEKLSQDISDTIARTADISTQLKDFDCLIQDQTTEFESMKSEYIALNKVINGLSSDLADVSTNQQMSKNSILALAESVDALNKKITIGFVTIGIITAIGVITPIILHFI